MLEEDQREIRANSKAHRHVPKAVATRDLSEQLDLHSQQRAKRTLEILEKIGAPTIANIGADGSQAISVLALHSRLSVMKKVLASFEESYSKEPSSVYHEAIPSLTDRILIIEHQKQRFGTQWMLGADGNFFLPPVEDFEHMNERRAVHGLGKSKHPIDLTYGVPEHEPSRSDTQESDQRPVTNEEYDNNVSRALD